jgi:outer membrane lipoprotein-sorting protein
LNAQLPSPDELLKQAEASLRSQEVPAGPSEAVVARTLAALLESSESPGTVAMRRRIPRMAIPIAAALLLALGGLVYFESLTSVGPPVAWADVAAKLRDARTLTYSTSTKIQGSAATMTARHWMKAPGRMRVESSNGFIAIMDGDPGAQLFLDAPTKTAYFSKPPRKATDPGAANSATPTDQKPKDRVTGKVVPGVQVVDRMREKDGKIEFSGFDNLRNLADIKGEPIGKKQIGEVEAQGFRIQENGLSYTAWIDPKTRQPLVIEHTLRTGDKELTMTMSDFVFDAPLDDALFSLKPPAGYKVTEGQLEIATSEESFVQLLRLYAEKSGGKFPPKLDDWADYDKQLQTEQYKRPGAVTDPQFLQLVQTATRGLMFVLQYKDKYVYRPEGIKLGDADKMLLWYRPEGSDEYRVIYGDLHVGTLTADQVPEKPAK